MQGYFDTRLLQTLDITEVFLKNEADKSSYDMPAEEMMRLGSIHSRPNVSFHLFFTYYIIKYNMLIKSKTEFVWSPCFIFIILSSTRSLPISKCFASNWPPNEVGISFNALNFQIDLFSNDRPGRHQSVHYPRYQALIMT